MSKTKIPEKTKLRLWVRAGGRCEYKGCNEPLWQDSLTLSKMNAAYIAHIVADSPNGPRGDEQLSEQLASDISNLMLMCDEHHRLIDKEDVDGHPVERLREMKNSHEMRIEMVTSIGEDMQSHVLFYGANVGEHSSPLNWNDTTCAMLPIKYPAEKPAIELSLGNSSFRDDRDSYWEIESEHLKNQFRDKVKRRLDLSDIHHLSVFSIAPQPLLILLGTLISDIYSTDVYQLHREPRTWKWQNEPDDFEYIVHEPTTVYKKVALNLSLSGNIDNSRITNVLGTDTSIWTVTVPSPYVDFLKGENQLREFRVVLRKLFNKIKRVYGQDNQLHIFPATPVAAAIELGRVWMPKADLPILIYDENKKVGGFHYALSIGENSVCSK